MKVKSENEVAQSCSTLSNLMDCSLPGSSVHGVFQVRVLEWGAIAFSESYCKLLITLLFKHHPSLLLMEFMARKMVKMVQKQSMTITSLYPYY